jgi:hypothetical protein
MALFKSMNVDALTRWRQAHTMVLISEEWQQDEELQNMPALDILLAFEDFSRVSEREYEEKARHAAVEKTSKEQKACKGFKVVNTLPYLFWKVVLFKKWECRDQIWMCEFVIVEHIPIESMTLDTN